MALPIEGTGNGRLWHTWDTGEVVRFIVKDGNRLGLGVMN